MKCSALRTTSLWIGRAARDAVEVIEALECMAAVDTLLNDCAAIRHSEHVPGPSGTSGWAATTLDWLYSLRETKDVSLRCGR